MPWTTAHVTTSAGGVDFAAVAIAGYYEVLWARAARRARADAGQRDRAVRRAGRRARRRGGPAATRPGRTPATPAASPGSRPRCRRACRSMRRPARARCRPSFPPMRSDSAIADDRRAACRPGGLSAHRPVQPGGGRARGRVPARRRPPAVHAATAPRSRARCSTPASQPVQPSLVGVPHQRLPARTAGTPVQRHRSPVPSRRSSSSDPAGIGAALSRLDGCARRAGRHARRRCRPADHGGRRGLEASASARVVATRSPPVGRPTIAGRIQWEDAAGHVIGFSRVAPSALRPARGEGDGRSARQPVLPGHVLALRLAPAPGPCATAGAHVTVADTTGRATAWPADG